MQKDQQVDMEEDDEDEGGFRAWLEDNLRIILSILVVFAIAGGIYSYSQRSQAPAISEETSSEKSDDAMSDQDSKEALSSESDAEKESTEKSGDSKKTPNTATSPAAKNSESTQSTTMAPTSTESRETDTSFIEAAVRGDGATHLARRAFGKYLEKNADPSLSKEQKIYVEDYLRKHVGYGRIHVGTSLEFSKSLIQEAIGKSKQLNSQQIAHLKQYSNRVPSL